MIMREEYRVASEKYLNQQYIPEVEALFGTSVYNLAKHKILYDFNIFLAFCNFKKIEQINNIRGSIFYKFNSYASTIPYFYCGEEMEQVYDYEEFAIFFKYNDILIAINNIQEDYVDVIFNKDCHVKIDEMIKELNHFVKNDLILKCGLKFNMLPKMDLTWDDLIIEDFKKNLLIEKINCFFKSLEYLKGNKYKTRYGIILNGPPGTGKSKTGKIIYNNINKNFILVTAKDLESEHGSSKIKYIFDIARKFTPCILYFEDLDLIGMDREFNANNFLGELLTNMDGFYDQDGILVIANTNNFDLLDKSLADRPGRFDLVLNFDTLNAEMAKKTFYYFLNLYNLTYKGSDEDIIKKFIGKTPAFVELIVTDCLKNKIMESNNDFILTEQNLLQNIQNFNILSKNIGFRSSKS